jgi:hypothetical protein
MAQPGVGVTDRFRDRPGAWVDLGLTLPIVLIYQVAVVFLGVHNATDVVTGTLLSLSAGDRTKYLLATLAIGVIFAGTFALLGRGQAFRPRKFVQVLVEGTVYAFVMAGSANLIVGRIFAWLPAANVDLLSSVGDALAAVDKPTEGRFVGFIMSLGAGFYEELAFRVLLFGLGAKVLVWLFGHQRVELAGTKSASGFSFQSLAIMTCWAIGCAMVFSGVHYIGPLSDTFKLSSFTFRTLLGLALTLIFVTRGFAAAVWTHAIYDVWVLVLQ